MKVKFVGGPYHGKTKDINPDPLIRTRGVSVAVMSDRKADQIDMYDSTWPPSIGVLFKNHRYHLRMMSIRMGKDDYYAPAMHPDGSVFLVHESYGVKK